MIDVQPTNEKLVIRAERIIREAVGCGEEDAAVLLKTSGKRVKHAVVMGLLGVSADEADRLLAQHSGRIREVLKNHEQLL